MYREHRARLMAELSARKAAAVIPTATPKVRNHDCDYRFRPDSDFWYLTGFAEPGSVLVLTPGLAAAEDAAARAPQSVLFLRERDAEMETWNGRRLGVERACEALGVDRARPIGELWEALPELLKGYARVVWRTGLDQERDRRMIGVLEKLRRMARSGVVAPSELIDTAAVVHELRLRKDAAELECLRKAAEITREAHLAAMAAAAPGRGEHELEALLEYTFRRRGSTGPAYTSIVAGGANACILHYTENDQPLRDGELLLIDAGAEWEYYACDVTRTFPVNGTFTAEQRAIYELVLESQTAAIAAVRPGATLQAIHEATSERLARGLIGLGLVAGELETVLAEERCKRFFMHKTGHWLGLDVHDCGAYTLEDGPRALEAGMVTTVEPGLYVAADDETVEERWRGIGVRIEDDVLVTAGGNEVLTAAIPKSVDEVESACRDGVLASVS